MATDAQDATARARQSRRTNCKRASAAALGAAAMTSHASLHANTAAVGMAGTMFLVTTGITAYNEINQAPAEIIWIWAALAGTMAGSFAAVMASLIMSPRAKWTRHILHLLLAFVFGLIGAPLAAIAWDPQPPKHIPLSVVWFAISGLCGFVAPAVAIALHKRSEGLADDMIDRVTTPREAREQAKRKLDQDQEDQERNDQ